MPGHHHTLGRGCLLVVDREVVDHPDLQPDRGRDPVEELQRGEKPLGAGPRAAHAVMVGVA